MLDLTAWSGTLMAHTTQTGTLLGVPTMWKDMLKTFGIALLAVYVANNVQFVRNFVGPKA